MRHGLIATRPVFFSTAIEPVESLDRGARCFWRLPSAGEARDQHRLTMILDTRRIAALRAKEVGWKRMAAEMGVGTIYRVILGGSKTREEIF